MARTKYRIFDADTHHHYPNGEALAPYMESPGRPFYFGGGLGTDIAGGLDCWP